MVELQTHGAPVVLDLLLRRVCELGARPARAGEFSERAFLNGKLDLAQAEAIADLIASQSETAARAALRSLDGAFSARVRKLLRNLIDLRVYIEAAIDGVLIGCLYVPNGNPAPGPKFSYKLRWLQRLHAYAAELIDLQIPALLVGDYNVMPTDLDVYAPDRWRDDALFRPEC